MVPHPTSPSEWSRRAPMLPRPRYAGPVVAALVAGPLNRATYPPGGSSSGAPSSPATAWLSATAKTSAWSVSWATLWSAHWRSDGWSWSPRYFIASAASVYGLIRASESLFGACRGAWLRWARSLGGLGDGRALREVDE